MRNNVYYNWGGEGCYGGEAQHVNIVNNYYKPGPGTDESGKADRAYRIAKPDVYPENYSGEAYKKWLQTWGKFYIDGNKVVAIRLLAMITGQKAYLNKWIIKTVQLRSFGTNIPR